MLNGYLFGYYATPIVKLLSFFTEEYDVKWNERAESMLKTLAESCVCSYVQAPKTTEFPDIIRLWLQENNGEDSCLNT